jgi:hypothetical protein
MTRATVRARRVLIVGLVALGACTAALRPAVAQQRVNGSEAELEAAYIYNFAKFVEWPAEAISDGRLTIAVIDDDPMATALTRIVEGKRAQGRPIVVQTGRGHAETAAQIAVIGTLDDASVAWQLDRVRDRPVLTVGHSPRFLQLGGAIRFKSVENRLRFEINATAVAKAGLHMSAQLLELAWSRSK